MVLQERIEVSILPSKPLILLVSRSCAAFYLHFLYAPAFALIQGRSECGCQCMCEGFPLLGETQQFHPSILLALSPSDQPKTLLPEAMDV
jgi:hypothetical protein